MKNWYANTSYNNQKKKREEKKNCKKNRIHAEQKSTAI